MNLYPLNLLVIILSFSTLSAQSPSNEDFSIYSYAELDSILVSNGNIGNYPISLQCAQYAMDRASSEVGEKDTLFAYYAGTLGALKLEIGQHSEANALLSKAIKVMELNAVTFNTNYSQMLSSMAQLQAALSNFDAAEPLFLKAKEMDKALLGANNIQYAGSLNNIAAFFYGIKKYEEAELNYLECQAIVTATVGVLHPYNAILVSNLAALYHSMEKYNKCEAMYKESLSIIEQSLGKENQNYTISMNNLAALYYHLERFEDAEKLHLETMAINKKITGDKHPNYANDLNNLAYVYEHLKRYEEAENLYKESIEIYKNLFGYNHSNYTRGLNNLSALYYKMGNTELAYAYNLAAIACNSENFNLIFPNTFKTDSTLSENSFLASNLIQKLSKEAALDFEKLEFRSPSTAVDALITRIKILHTEYEQLNTDKKTVAANDKLIEEYNLCKSVRKFYTKTRDDFSSKKNKLQVLKESNGLLIHAISVAKELNQDQYIKEAFRFAENNKSMLLADALKGNRARTLGDMPDSLILQELNLQNKKDELKKQLYLTKDKAKVTQLRAQENELSQEIEEFLKSIKDKYPKYHSLKYENITTSAEEVQNLLDKNTLFLEYSIADSAIFLFSISQSKVDLINLEIPSQTLQNKIKKLRLSLIDYQTIKRDNKKAYDDFSSAAHWFYENLLSKTLSTHQDIKNLIIVTDGELGHLPFGVFLTKPANQKSASYKGLSYLINQYNISYNYSATLWKEIKISKPKKNNNEILACAASYPSPDSVISSPSTTNSFTRAPHIENLRKVLQPLPAIANEINLLSELFNGKFVLGKESNEAFIKKEAKEYSVIHLAMHGVLHPRVPMLSSLAFTENNDSIEDNFLQAYEISRMELNADLVVLSACETGYGKFEQGEGIVSLARSFMYAGVPSLVVSLWQVNDASTAIIMNSFYSYLAEGLPKDEALRKAKLEYLNLTEGAAGHPAFWSPFIQVGDNSSVLIKKKSDWLMWLALLVVLFIAIGISLRIFLKNPKQE